MKSALRYLVLGVVAYLFFLVATLPANFAYRHLADRLKPTVLASLSGTIWSGRA